MDSSPINVKREVLIGFDLLLAVVIGLVLYAASARDPQAPPDFFDGLQLLLVVSARSSSMGWRSRRSQPASPSLASLPIEWRLLARISILLVNLAWTAWLYTSFMRPGALFQPERWQIAYPPFISFLGAVVVVLFLPPSFGVLRIPPDLRRTSPSPGGLA